MTNTSTSRAVLRSSLLFAGLVASFLLLVSSVSAASVTVNCSGTAGSPTAVTESSLVGDDITFADTGGDGYCELDEDLLSGGNGAAASVTVDAGVTLTHPSEDTTGVAIETTGNFTLNGNIDVSEKGCTGGASAGAHGRGPNTGTGVCAVDTTGYGDGSTANSVNDFGGGAGYGGIGGAADTGNTGARYGSPATPTLLGSGGGGGNGGGDVTGGDGGGYVRLVVAGTLDADGSILADGGVGGAAVNAGGGGSGGAIYINAATLSGSGLMSADGGNGGNSTNTNNEDASGGGGGRIAVYYGSNSFTLSNILASAGAKGSGATNASDGAVGSTFLLNRAIDDGIGDLRVTSGLDLTNGLDVARTNITIDSGAVIVCDAQTTISFTASNDFTDNGSIMNCSAAITTANVTAGGTLTTAGVTWTFSDTDTINLGGDTWTNSGTNAITFSKDGATMDWAVANDLTLNNFTITGPDRLSGGSADSGVITMDNAIDVTLSSTNILAGVEWTNLVDVTIPSGSSINANGRGCQGGQTDTDHGYGPNAGTGICAIDTTGYGDGATGNFGSDFGGGAGHGGAGGPSDTSDTGATYGSNTAPVLLGSGGGAGDGSGTVTGGDGGGRIRLDLTGELDLGGTISADGEAGGAAVNAGGGGSGGSIYITAGTLDGSGGISADGGAGGASTNTTNEDGSGGGGGRVAIYYETDGSTFLSGMSAANTVTGGSAEGDSTGGTNGSNGTLYTFQVLVFSAASTSVSSGTSIDTLTITFNQNVDIVDGSAGDGLDVLTLSASSGTCTIDNADYAASSTTTLVLNVTCSTTDDTSITINPTYTTSGSNEIHDTSGSTEMDNARTVTGMDAAGPILLSSSPANSDSNISSSADIVLTFTEAINTGNFAYTCCGTGTDPGRSGAWTVSDTVYTISPSSNWTAGDDITIDITTAEDSATNTFGGAASAAADPFTFTIANVGDTPTNVGGVVTTATLLTPNGGQTFEGGDSTTITWSAGANKLDTISLYYTTDNGKTYTLISEGEDNDGAYVWTVPNITSSTVRVKVVAVTSTGGEIVADSSNSNFSIIEVTDPGLPNTGDDDTDDETDDQVSGPVTSMLDRAGNTIDLVEGSLFRGDTLSDVYLVKNGMRYVFPSAEVFLSYYDDFDDVYFMQDDQLRKLELGGRVTMAPGEMIKIQSDNRVFQVQSDGTIRHVPDEATAIALYGDTWNQQITDISVIFWGDYPQGDALESLQ